MSSPFDHHDQSCDLNNHSKLGAATSGHRHQGITPAQVHWQSDEMGHTVPISQSFGDVYYSLVDGLAESRYVFIEQNRLAPRFERVLTGDGPKSTFTIAELGFGTGLNLLATWQLWRKLADTYYPYTATAALRPRLHIISTEKYPLTYEDLARSLSSWQETEPELAPLISRLLSQYPPLIEGCHRLHLDDTLTLDLWFGDAATSLAKLDNRYGAAVDAWFLDGFAPSCNESLWADQIFEQIGRLSKLGTTAATFSCAGVVKRGLKSAGFDIQKVKGFGRKREMLTATIQEDLLKASASPSSTSSIYHAPKQIKSVAIIGAGVSGLMSAWSLAQRGVQVHLLDKSAPLAGASGNPRALLAPKLTPIHHVADHLHSIGYLYSGRCYRFLDHANLSHHQAIATIFEATGALDLLTKANINVDQIDHYPDKMAETLSHSKAKIQSGLNEQDLTYNVFLPQAGLVNPKALADTVLAHPLIQFEPRLVSRLEPADSGVQLYCQSHKCPAMATTKGNLKSDQSVILRADSVIIAAAFDSGSLDSRIFNFRKIRGQLSWFAPNADQLAKLPKLPLKFGGYCAAFTPSPDDDTLNPLSAGQPQFLLGASFVRNDSHTDIRDSEHQISRDKLVTALPELAKVIPAEVCNWHARAGIRAQTPDYHPLVGCVNHTATSWNHSDQSQGSIWTLSGMGSKGFAFAPICAEALADLMTGSFAPLSMQMLDRLSPNRSRLQVALHP